MRGCTLAVLLFPNFFQDFTLVDDLAAAPVLPPIADVQQMAQKNNPELSAAFAALEVANHEVTVARAGHLPTLVLDYFYGIDANHFAVNTDGIRNLGYAAAATLNIPVWHWGAIESKVKQAELQRHQAQVELSAAQRQAIADLQSFYSEAETAHAATGHVAQLRRSRGRQPAADQPALPGRRGHRAGGGGRAEHADAGAQQLSRRRGPLPRGHRQSANADGDVLSMKAQRILPRRCLTPAGSRFSNIAVLLEEGTGT